MKKNQRLFSFYPYLIIALVLLLCLLVCPMKLIGHTTYQSSSLETGLFANLELTDGSIVISEFTPSHRQLDSISFRFLSSGKAPEGTVTLELYDKTQEKVYDITLESGDIMNYRWIDFPIDMELETDEIYAWQLRAYDYDEEDSSLFLYSGGTATGPDESGKLYYNGEAEKELTPAVIFSYTDRVDTGHAMPYYIIFFLFGLLLFTACRKFEKTSEDVQI